jgi:hypothetical protein
MNRLVSVLSLHESIDTFQKCKIFFSVSWIDCGFHESTDVVHACFMLKIDIFKCIWPIYLHFPLFNQVMNYLLTHILNTYIYIYITVLYLTIKNQGWRMHFPFYWGIQSRTKGEECNSPCPFSTYLVRNPSIVPYDLICPTVY